MKRWLKHLIITGLFFNSFNVFGARFEEDLVRFHKHCQQSFNALNQRELFKHVDGEDVRWQISHHLIVAKVDYDAIKELEGRHQVVKLGQRLNVAVKETVRWCLEEAAKEEGWGAEFNHIFNNLTANDAFLEQLANSMCFDAELFIKPREGCISIMKTVFLFDLIRQHIASFMQDGQR